MLMGHGAANVLAVISICPAWTEQVGILCNLGPHDVALSPIEKWLRPACMHVCESEFVSAHAWCALLCMFLITSVWHPVRSLCECVCMQGVECAHGMREGVAAHTRAGWVKV
jgi:hypothetical protein